MGGASGLGDPATGMMERDTHIPHSPSEGVQGQGGPAHHPFSLWSPNWGRKSTDPLESGPAIMGTKLSPKKQGQLQQVLQAFPEVLSALPGWTEVMHHHIATLPGQKVRDTQRPLLKKMWETIQRELDTMLERG